MKKKKIAVVGIRGIPATYGGIEKHCEMIYPLMVKEGFDVTIYARGYYCKDNITDYKGVKIKIIPVINIRGFESFVHSFIASVHATFSDADIIHFHAQGPALFSWIPRIFAPNKMVCYTCNGLDKDRDKWGKIGKFILTLGEIASVKFPHCRIGVSEELKTYHENKYNIKMHKIFNGILIEEPFQMNNTKRFNIEPNNYFMFVGRLVPEKAPEILIEAFKKVKTDKKLLIVGDSAGTDNYVSYLKKLASNDSRIIFTSYVYGDDLKELYSNAFAYVSSSKLEGLPLTILEAMSYSIPVILSDIPPHLEAINQGYNVGTSFKVNDIDDCAKAIEKMLSLPDEQIQEMKKSAKNLVDDVFNWEKIASQTINILTNIHTTLKKIKNVEPNEPLEHKKKDQKPKIAIVNKYFFLKGGMDKVTFEEAKLLESSGHEIAFFSMHHPLNPKEYKYNKYFIDNVEFSNLGKEYSLAEKFRIAKNFICNKQAAQRFEEFLLDFKPDIIHCHGISHQITPSILPVAKKYNIPIVQTLHDYQIICPNYTLLRANKFICDDLKCSTGNYLPCITNKCVKNSFSASVLSSLEMYINDYKSKYINNINMFISPSKFLRDQITASGMQEDKIVHIPNFVNIDEFEPEYSNKGYFLYAGRLSLEKGLYTLLNTFKELPEARLVVAGTGPLETELIDFKKKNNLNNIEFVGFKAGEELKELIKFSKALILPSEWYENAPLSIIEAFSYGKPVIASKLGGITEMVTEDFNGYLFSKGNIEELKSKIMMFENDKMLSAKLGQNARDFALNNYTGQKHLQSLLELYNSFVAIEKSEVGENIVV